MAVISNAMKIEAIQMALSSNKNLKQTLQEVASKNSNAPQGVTISDEDVPTITDNHLKMMFAVSKPMDGIIEMSVKNSDKETGDEKKGNRKVISEVKKLVKKIKPMNITPSKLDEVVNKMKNQLEIK